MLAHLILCNNGNMQHSMIYEDIKYVFVVFLATLNVDEWQVALKMVTSEYGM
jgi:hypothetical protein